jgi:hypothetical protein
MMMHHHIGKIIKVLYYFKITLFRLLVCLYSIVYRFQEKKKTMIIKKKMIDCVKKSFCIRDANMENEDLM